MNNASSGPILRWGPSRLDGDETASALEVLSPTERIRYGEAPPRRAASFLAGRTLLRQLVAELTNEVPAAVDLVAVCADCGGPHGRPTIPGSVLHLSLAHTSDAVVAAASWHRAVGVDIEAADPSRRVLAAIGALAGEPTLLRWTRIEAILKADGRGLRVDPAQVHLANVGGQLEGWVSDAPARYAVSEVDLAPGLRASVAVAIP